MTPLTRLHIALIRLRSRLSSARRWHGAASRPHIALDYGLDTLPGPHDIVGGGIVKIQDLLTRFPSRREAPTLLYLVSSALPHDAAEQIHACKNKGGIFVLNQNGVAYPGWHGPGWQHSNKPLTRAHALADYIIYQSDFCRRTAQRFLGPVDTPHTILHNPVDTSVFTPADTPPADGPLLLLAGTHQFRYRAETAVRALGALRTRLPTARLLLAGRHTWTDPDSARLHLNTLAAELGVADRLQHHPTYTQHEAPALFRRAHLLLHTKYNDPCPRLVVEAMACGLPVVHSASGGLPELIPPAAGAAIPAPEDYEHDHPPTPEALADAVLDLWSRHPQARQAARTHATTHLDTHAWLNAHVRIFENLKLPASSSPHPGSSVTLRG